ncbi:alpha/beta fold hydrolase [bacterium]|nr:alpha/beta fold hydrolase [bacterium]
MQEVQHVSWKENGAEHRLAFIRREAKQGRPWLVFFSGFRSDKAGSKALFLDEWAGQEGLGLIRFDYRGHGESSGRFEEGTIGQWKEDSIRILDELLPKNEKAILVGSSMGGWMMLLAALARPERVSALIGIAAAPDFTEDLLAKAFTSAQQQEMRQTGRVMIPDCYGTEPYAITQTLLTEGQSHLLLRDAIPLTMPVRLLHGMRDEDVPYLTSIRLAEKLQSTDVCVEFLKSGDHRMSSPEALNALKRIIQPLL